MNQFTTEIIDALVKKQDITVWAFIQATHSMGLIRVRFTQSTAI